MILIQILLYQNYKVDRYRESSQPHKADRNVRFLAM